MSIFEFLEQNKITYQRCDHPAVFTVEEANRLVPELPGMHTKNLFLRDKKATHLFLLVCADDKQVDLKQLAIQIGVKNLSLASAERLEENLGITPGAVSILALVNDMAGKVRLLLDKDVNDAAAITAHPLVNTATLVIQKPDLDEFLRLTNHFPQLVLL